MLITLETFEKYIKARQDVWAVISKLNAVGIDSMTFCEPFEKAEEVLYKVLFNGLQKDIIDWWLYECKGVEGKRDPKYQVIHKKTGLVIPTTTVKELYEYLETLDD